MASSFRKQLFLKSYIINRKHRVWDPATEKSKSISIVGFGVFIDDNKGNSPNIVSNSTKNPELVQHALKSGKTLKRKKKVICHSSPGVNVLNCVQAEVMLRSISSLSPSLSAIQATAVSAGWGVEGQFTSLKYL